LDAPLLITLLVVVVAFFLLVTELIPPAITAIGAACLLMLTGVLSVEQGLSGFANEATITVLCMLILAAAIERTGVLASWSRHLVDLEGRRKGLLLVVIVLFCGVVSAFTNNTTLVAIMVPLLVTMSAAIQQPASRFLMPMAFATTLGGMLTLIGTSTNILASSISQDLGYGAFSMFEFTKAAIPVFLVGAAYLVFVAPRLLRGHEGGSVAEGFDLKEYLAEVVIGEGSPGLGKPWSEGALLDPKEVEVLRIVRHDLHIERPPASTVLEKDDILLVRGSRQAIIRLHQSPEVKLLPEVVHWLPSKASGLEVVETVIPPGSPLAGATLAGFRFRGRFDAVVLAVRKRERLFANPIATLVLEPGDALLVSGTPAAIAALRADASLVVAQDISGEVPRVHHVGPVLGIFAGIILASTLDLVSLPVAALSGVALVVLVGGLRLDELQRAVRWDILFLLAGLIPLGLALQTTGAAALAAAWLADLIRDWPPLASLAVVYLAAMLLTEVMSNNACVALMLPVSASLASALGLNPFTFILAVVFGSSLAFMTPVGYQTYLMIYGPGGFRFSDFVKVGAPLNLLCMATSVLALAWFWPLR
jgi:di/tricarboxylate transporter